jgi:SAM-dependent methyltransferase
MSARLLRSLLVLGPLVAGAEGPRVVPARRMQPAPGFGLPLDVPFVATPEPVVEAMLELAGVGPQDVVYDLGCGDGRIPIAAARLRGARGVCIDINPLRIEEAREAARKAGVEDRIRFRREDLFEADLHDATVVMLYLRDDLNERLRPHLLRQLHPGTRVVSHQFRMGDWRPEKMLESHGRTLYLWTIPAR